MNKNKVLIIFLTLIACSLIGIKYKNSSSTDTLKTLSLSRSQDVLSLPVKYSVKTNDNIYNKISSQDASINKKSIEKSFESQVPWEELHKKWLEDLKTFLLSVNDNDGLRMFNAYAKARKKYLEEDTKLGKSYQKIHASNVFDQKKEDQLAIESQEIFNKANEVNKRIFGQYYPAVKEFHKEFENSIQVYSRDVRISLDFGFEN